MSEPLPPTVPDPHSSPPAGTGPAAGPAAQMVGGYRLLQKLGEGGMGEVWLAEQTEPVGGRSRSSSSRPGMDTRAGRRALRGRAPGARAHGPPGHRHGVRRRRDAGGPAVLRDGVRQGRADHHVLRPSPPRRSRERLELFVAGLRGRSARPPEGHHPPRPQAVERAGRRSPDDRPVPKIIDFGVAKAIDPAC